MSDKIYASINERQAAYRQRVAKERSETQTLHNWVGLVLTAAEKLGWVEPTFGLGRDQQKVIADLQLLHTRLKQEHSSLPKTNDNGVRASRGRDEEQYRRDKS